MKKSCWLVSLENQIGFDSGDGIMNYKIFYPSGSIIVAFQMKLKLVNVWTPVLQRVL